MTRTTYSTVAGDGSILETEDTAVAEWWARLGARVTAHTRVA